VVYEFGGGEGGTTCKVITLGVFEGYFISSPSYFLKYPSDTYYLDTSY